MIPGVVFNPEQMAEAGDSDYPSRSRSSSCSSDDEQPEITLDDLSADTLAALKAHLAIKDAVQVIRELFGVHQSVVLQPCRQDIYLCNTTRRNFVSSVCRGLHSQRLRALAAHFPR